MDRRKQEIMEAFVKLVTRYGFDKTTMQDVAREVGVSVGTIYNTFANKEALIDAFNERMFSEFDEFIRSILAKPMGTEERLRELLLGFVQGSNRIVRQNRAFLEIMRENRVIFKYIGSKLVNTRDHIRINLNTSVRQILEQGTQEGIFEVESAAATAELIVDALTEYWATPMMTETPIETVTQKTENMVAFILRALRRTA